MRFLLWMVGVVTLLSGLEGFNGKTLLLTLSSPSGYITMNEHNISVLPHPSLPNQGIAWVPIDYYTTPQEMNLTWHSDLGEVNIPLSIKQFKYPIETLSVDSAKVTPPPETLERIALEKTEAEMIYKAIMEGLISAHARPCRFKPPTMGSLCWSKIATMLEEQ
ncbi:MAG: hypothetical protein IE883_03930 [Epsilonproteobacteria bacterium]|nr:hypothetical protein [Campylobacterota bacterium]